MRKVKLCFDKISIAKLPTDEIVTVCYIYQIKLDHHIVSRFILKKSNDEAFYDVILAK